MHKVECVHCHQPMALGHFFANSIHISPDFQFLTCECEHCHRSIQAKLVKGGIIPCKLGEVISGSRQVIPVPNLQATVKSDRSGVVLESKEDSGVSVFKKFVPRYHTSYKVESVAEEPVIEAATLKPRVQKSKDSTHVGIMDSDFHTRLFQKEIENEIFDKSFDPASAVISKEDEDADYDYEPGEYKERTFLATAFLTLAVVVYSLSVLVAGLLWMTQSYNLLPNIASHVYPIMIAVSCLHLACLWGIFHWHRWGVYAFCAASCLSMIVNANIGMGLHNWKEIAVLAVLFIVLRHGGEESVWSQLE